MPGLDGYETTQKIRAGAAGECYQFIPIIAVTANAMVGDREKCLSAGMNDYVQKPINPELLGNAIEMHLQRRHVSCDQTISLNNQVTGEELHSCLAKISKDLEDYNVEAEEKITELLSKTGDHQLQYELARIRAQVGNYEYDEAFALVEKLRASSNLNNL